MLLRTFDKVNDLFRKHNGYMSFPQLKAQGITVTQMRELETVGSLERFSRGWYWCTSCGLKKPGDYKYIELSKIVEDAIISRESACYLNGILKQEPPMIVFSTGYNNRNKIDVPFSVHKHYLPAGSIGPNVVKSDTQFGSYLYLDREAAVCDCLKQKNKMDAVLLVEVLDHYRECQVKQLNRLSAYADMMGINKKDGRYLTLFSKTSEDFSTTIEAGKSSVGEFGWDMWEGHI